VLVAKTLAAIRPRSAESAAVSIPDHLLRRGTPLLNATTGPALPKLSNRLQLADNLRLESYLGEPP
jgi:hypothetical protein